MMQKDVVEDTKIHFQVSILHYYYQLLNALNYNSRRR